MAIRGTSTLLSMVKRNIYFETNHILNIGNPTYPTFIHAVKSARSPGRGGRRYVGSSGNIFLRNVSGICLGKQGFRVSGSVLKCPELPIVHKLYVDRNNL